MQLSWLFEMFDSLLFRLLPYWDMLFGTLALFWFVLINLLCFVDNLDKTIQVRERQKIHKEEA